MKAIVLHTPGDVSQLEHQEQEMPLLRAEEVLIQLRAISINPVDVKTRAGKGVYGRLKDENPLILGWDISGVVKESASGEFKAGDPVFGMVNFPGHGKAYAEYVAAPAAHLAMKPATITYEAAAASTLAALTAFQAIVRTARVASGQRVLIQAAAGGVGHFAVQIAKHLGAHVTGTSSPRNKDFILSLGADAHIDYTSYDWEAHPDEFDFVLDCVGGDTIEKSITATRTGGKVISIPTGLNETVVEQAKAKGVDGRFMLVQSSGDDMRKIAKLLEQGVIRPHIMHSYPFEQMAEAHLQVESGRTVGKVVVTL